MMRPGAAQGVAISPQRAVALPATEKGDERDGSIAAPTTRTAELGYYQSALDGYCRDGCRAAV